MTRKMAQLVSAVIVMCFTVMGVLFFLHFAVQNTKPTPSPPEGGIKVEWHPGIPSEMFLNADPVTDPTAVVRKGTGLYTGDRAYLTNAPYDLNANGDIDGSDLGMLLANWGSPYDGSDLGMLLASWGWSAQGWVVHNSRGDRNWWLITDEAGTPVVVDSPVGGHRRIAVPHLGSNEVPSSRDFWVAFDEATGE